MSECYPTRAPEIMNPDCVEREVFCRHYDHCLDLVITNHWPGFSCQDCSGFESQQWSPEYGQEDAKRCAVLLLCVFHSSKLRHISPSTLLTAMVHEEERKSEFVDFI